MGPTTSQLFADRPTEGQSVVRATAIFAAIALSSGTAGWAQEAPSAAPAVGLEEIVVTAEKRAESLQNVPGSVAALTSEELDLRGISSVASLMQGDVPSVKVEPFAGNQTVLEVGMRGFINPNGTDITNENPVPIYIDDVYYGRQNSLALELNDLERIEVLRGPQGTLFGKNAEGGALRLVSKEPTGEFDVNAKAEGGNYGYWKGIAHVNLPAIGPLSAKVDFLSTDNNGWTTNPAPGQYNYGVTKSTAEKLTLLLKASDSVKAEYAVDYTDLKSSEYWNAQINYSATGSPYSALWPNQTSTPLSEPYATYRPLDPQTYLGHRINVDWAIADNVNLKSISAYREDKATLYNTAATSAVVPGPEFSPGYFTPGGPNFFNCVLGPTICNGALTDPVPEYIYNHRQFSQEFQLTGKTEQLDWVLGLFYIHESGTQGEVTNFGTVLENALSPGFPFLPVKTPTGSAVLSPLFGPVGTAGADVTESSKAIFGQVNYRPPGFDDKLSATVGVRVGHDDKSAVRPANGGDVYLQPTYPVAVGLPVPAGLPCPQTPQCSPSFTNTETSPMAAVAYNWTKDVSTYFRFSTGYQGAALGVGSQTFKYVDPSKVNSFEVGLKSEFADHTVRLNIAAFYEDWMKPQEDIQTTSSSTVEFFNGPDIHISGVELDAAYQPLPGLTFNGSLSVLHGSQGAVTNPYAPPAGFPPVVAAFHIEALPSWAASFAVNDDIARTDYGVWRASLQANGTASFYSVPNVATPIASYWLLDGRLALAEIPLGANGGKFEVAVWGRNLLNKSYNTFIYQIQGPNTDGSYGPPRMWGGSLAFRFR